MTQPPASLAPALDLLSPRRPCRRARGGRGGAGGRARRCRPCCAFAGLVAAQIGRSGRAPFPISAGRWRSRPTIIATRLNLATALLATGALDEAGAVCAAGGDDPRLLRIAAYVHQQQGRLAEAAAAYRGGARRRPRRFGELEQSRQRPRRAWASSTAPSTPSSRRSRCGPTSSRWCINLSERARPGRAARGAAGGDARGGAGRARTMPRVQTELGLAEAERARFRGGRSAPIARRSGSIPASSPAYLELGLLLENLEPDRRARRAGRRRPRRAAWRAPSSASSGPGRCAARAGSRRRCRSPRRRRASINPVRRAQLLAEIARPARRRRPRLRRLRAR